MLQSTATVAACLIMATGDAGRQHHVRLAHSYTLKTLALRKKRFKRSESADQRTLPPAMLYSPAPCTQWVLSSHCTASALHCGVSQD